MTVFRRLRGNLKAKGSHSQNVLWNLIWLPYIHVHLFLLVKYYAFKVLITIYSLTKWFDIRSFWRDVKLFFTVNLSANISQLGTRDCRWCKMDIVMWYMNRLLQAKTCVCGLYGIKRNIMVYLMIWVMCFLINGTRTIRAQGIFYFNLFYLTCMLRVWAQNL